MKRGTIDHPKTKRLARRLKLEPWGAVGILESLWHWTAKYARLGDIGRFSDEDIADGIGWSRSATELVSALVAERWIDEHPGCRLVIHDWREHADMAVKKTVHNRGESFFESPDSDQIPESSRKFQKVPELESQNVPADGSGSGSGTGTGTGTGTGENSTSSSKPRGGVSREVEDCFTEFYAAYPRKVGKDNARRAYERRLTGAADLQAMHKEIMAGLALHLPQLKIEAGREGGKFCPHPSTWLNAGRWQDALPTNGNGTSKEEPSPWDTFPRYVSCDACDKNHRVHPNPEVCPVSGVVPKW